MALPGHRRTSSDKRRRAAHFALKKIATFPCAKCQRLIIPHHVCDFCGFYKGRAVLIRAAASPTVTRSSRAHESK